jgi:hypothetical protein
MKPPWLAHFVFMYLFRCLTQYSKSEVLQKWEEEERVIVVIQLQTLINFALRRQLNGCVPPEWIIQGIPSTLWLINCHTVNLFSFVCVALMNWNIVFAAPLQYYTDRLQLMKHKLFFSVSRVMSVLGWTSKDLSCLHFTNWNSIRKKTSSTIEQQSAVAIKHFCSIWKRICQFKSCFSFISFLNRKSCHAACGQSAQSAVKVEAFCD